MASSSNPEPTVVLYKSSVCRHCTALANIWDNVVTALKAVNPKLRFYVLTAKDNSGKFDENTAPKDLFRYAKWFPMILLVPGRTWDSAMANLGPKNPIEIKDGVQIMNAYWNDDKLEYSQKYDIRKPEEFVKWLKDSFENKDFKRVQTEGSTQSSSNAHHGPHVPTVNTPAQPIQPLLSGIVKPGNSSTNYAASGSSSSDRHSAMEPGGDVCSMRIISRPSK
ncbi:Hypothetical protein HVR_LOCUS1288 [uncultured virus]|nr:Hypothetical protein HVR_LOCUS1288 [uncultured virus]